VGRTLAIFGGASGGHVKTNPTLRAQLRADDEGYVQARAGYGPQVSVTGQYGYPSQSARQITELTWDVLMD